MGAVAPSDDPTNTASDTSWNYLGQHQKLTETNLNLPSGIIQMGARVYIPILGRFLSVDPVEGAGDNTYSYVNDPVNETDPDGKIAPIVAMFAWHLGRVALQQTIKIAAQHAAKQAVQQVAKKAVVHSTKKITQKAVPKAAQSFSRKLPDGRINSYGRIRAASKQGEMIGARKVTQFNPRTQLTRHWNETIDKRGLVRQVRPLKGNIKTKHYRFDKNGKYIGSW